MTKKNENGTIHKLDIDFERMTREYFYPDVITGDLSTMKIPTVDELCLLGTNNLDPIIFRLRQEEKTLRKLVNSAKLSKKLLSDAGAIPGDAGNEKCDWHGKGYEILPEELERELLSRKNGKAYDNAEEERKRKIFSCKYGVNVANWCHKCPHPIKCSRNCYIIDSAKPLTMAALEELAPNIINAATKSGVCNSLLFPHKHNVNLNLDPFVPVPQNCPNFVACHGAMPFEHEDCIMNESNSAECRKYLDDLIENNYKVRLQFVSDYINKIKSVINKAGYKPYLDRCDITTTAEGEQVFEITCNDKDLFLRRGIVTRTHDVLRHKRLLIVNMSDGRVLQFNRTNYPLIQESMWISSKDLDYLIENSDFRRIWLKMTERYRCAPFTNDFLESLLCDLAATRGLTGEYSE